MFCAALWHNKRLIDWPCTEAVPWAGLQASEIQNAIIHLGHQLDLSSPRVASDPFYTVLQYGLSRNPEQRRLSLEQTRAMFAEHLMVTKTDLLHDVGLDGKREDYQNCFMLYCV